jgi:TRAP-type mannitol/chloroaromatic compound transport system permease large subunit
MSNFAAGLLSFLLLLMLLALRVPIGVAMMAVGVGGFIWIQGLAPLLSFLKTTPFETFAGYSFSVIPLFLLMGNVASGSGLSARLFRGANALFGHHRGGMAMAAVGACAAFGTICGSSLATAATMGQVALPRCAGTATPARFRPARSPPAARSASWCRPRSPSSSTPF